MAKHRTWSPPGPYQIGDWVKIPSWTPPIMGQVVEDRGLIGHRRRHYYAVRHPLGEPDDPMITEYPAENMVPATAEEIEAALKEIEEMRRLSI
jgi:hypothetical protein